MKINTTKAYIVIIGSGALGSYITQLLCKMGNTKTYNYDIVLVDYDDIEDRNLVSQDFYPSELGKKKCEAVAERMHGFKTQVFPLDIKITKDNVNNLLTLCDDGTLPICIIDAVDNIETRSLLDQRLSTTVPVLHSAISQAGSGEVSWTAESSVLDDKGENTIRSSFRLSIFSNPEGLFQAEKAPKPTKQPPCELFRSVTYILATAKATTEAVAIYMGDDDFGQVDLFARTNKEYTGETIAQTLGFCTSFNITWGNRTVGDVFSPSQEIVQETLQKI